MAKPDASILLDAYSLQILTELQRDGRQTVAQLSAAVGLSRPGTTVYDQLFQVDLMHVVTAQEILAQESPSNGTDTISA